MGWEYVVVPVCGVVAEIALVLLLIRGRVFRTFPVFFAYLCWSLFSDTFFYYARAHYSTATFYRVSLVQLAVDSAMIFALLVEVAWSVLRPIRSSLPKYSWIVIAGLIALGSLVLWPVAGLVAPNNLDAAGMTLFRMEQTPAIVRAVFFLALAGFSQVLSIGWRDRELQIATGLGFYSIVSLAITVLHTHQAAGIQNGQYHWLDVLGAFSYIAAVFYWVYCFARRAAKRREFTPQMQSMLLAVAGAARSTRAVLEDTGVDNNEKRQD